METAPAEYKDKMKKENIQLITALVLSIVILFLGYFLATDDSGVFKGEMQGSSIRAKVIRVTEENNVSATGETTVKLIHFTALVLSGENRGKTVSVIQEIDTSYFFSPKSVEQNDKILIEAYTQGNETQFFFGDYIRITPLLWLAVLFCALIVLFSKSQGVKTLISLILTCISIFMVLIPAILNGKNIYLWAILVCVYVIVMTLSIVSGFNRKALCAAVGCLCGVASAGLITVIMNLFLNMTGLLEEESIYLYQLYPNNPINLKAIIFAMIIVGAMGAVMDVAMSISSSLYELKEKSPDISQKDLMCSGFTIGGDMMGTMANTLILAYIGSSLTSVLLFVAYHSNIQQVINKEIIVAEILQALVGSLGMLLTLPLTSFVCSVVYNRKVKKDAFG